ADPGAARRVRLAADRRFDGCVPARRCVGAMSASATVRRELRGASGVRSLLRSRPDRIAYVGWVGQGNAGDDAIFAAHRRAMSGLRLVAMPLDVGALAAPAVAALHRRRPGGVLRAGLIGGGTLVGRPDWRRRIDF